MKLYYVPGTCSLSPHIVLRESGLPFEPVQVNAKSHTLADGTDYYTINPLGYVPLLELGDGTHLREGPVIVQYVADQAPQRNLAPANGTLARYHLQEWLNLIATELHKGFGPLFNPATPDAYKAIVKESLIARLTWVDGQLAGQNYLMGENFSVADAYLFTVTNWIAPIGGMDISNLSKLNAFRARVAARPAVQEAMKVEGLLN